MNEWRRSGDQGTCSPILEVSVYVKEGDKVVEVKMAGERRDVELYSSRWEASASEGDRRCVKILSKVSRRSRVVRIA